MYDIRDLIKKTIALSEKRKALYFKFLENTADPRLRILIQIMISRLNQDAVFYNKLLESINEDDIEPIDFGVYDMISSLINQFGRRLDMPTSKTRKEFIHLVIETEKAVYALMMDIQGRLAQSEGRTDGITYRTISKAILNKRFRLEELENYKE
jgi:hypothetical protein